MGLNQEIESQRIEPGYNQTGKKKKKRGYILSQNQTTTEYGTRQGQWEENTGGLKQDQAPARRRLHNARTEEQNKWKLMRESP